MCACGQGIRAVYEARTSGNGRRDGEVGSELVAVTGPERRGESSR